MDFSTLLNVVPDSCALWVALIIIACKIVTVLLPPPAEQSKLVLPYQFVSVIALNIGWAVNRLQPGKTGILVPKNDSDAAKQTFAAPPIVRTSSK